MKTKHLFLMALLFSLVMPMQAQINLNKLGKQVKKSAEGQVEQKIKEKAARETREALDASERKLDNAVQGVFSKEDNNADTQTGTAVQGSVENGSKSSSQTSGSGSQSSGIALDQGTPDPYIGVPIGENVFNHYDKLSRGDIYYEWGDAMSHYWYESQQKSLKWLSLETSAFLDAISASTDGIPMIIVDQRGAYLPVGEMSINAYFGLYSALPKAAYPILAQGRAFLKVIAEGGIQKDLNKLDVVKASIKEDDKGEYDLYYAPSEYKQFGYGFPEPRLYDPFDTYKGDRVKRWKTEEARLMKLYRDNVSFDAVKATVINLLTGAAQATKSKNWHGAVLNSYILDVAVNDMMEHPNKVEDDDYTFAVQTYNKMAADNFPKWRAETHRQWKEFYSQQTELFSGATTIPKAATSNPKLEAEMIAIAKTIYDDGRVPVKAIIKYADWNYTHNAFGQIIDRYHTGYIIFKMQDGSHRMVDIGFKQLYNGGSYGKTQLRGIGLLNQTVDYK